MGAQAAHLLPLISYYQTRRPLVWEDSFKTSQPLVVEIGFGVGEELVKQANAHPVWNFVGIEQDWERIYKTLLRIHRNPRPLSNVRIIHGDARVSMERLFEQASITRMYSLFPCPWPKEKHEKHRLFSTTFLRLLNSRLKSGGEALIVTDYYPFFEWIQEQQADSGFISSVDKIRPQFGTKFERKWVGTGQHKFYEIRLQKENNVEVPVAEDVPMKSFKIKKFKPERFYLDDETGDPSVIFKDFIYDAQRERGLVYVLVAEGHLAQHFRIHISRTPKGDWRICRADGQNFFPTQGINRALERVHEAALQS